MWVKFWIDTTTASLLWPTASLHPEDWIEYRLAKIMYSMISPSTMEFKLVTDKTCEISKVWLYVAERIFENAFTTLVITELHKNDSFSKIWYGNDVSS